MTMADAIAVMKDGRIDQLGSATELYDHPRTEFVANFLGSSNLLDAAIASRAADVVEFDVENARVRVPAALVNGNADGAVRVGVRPEKIAIRPAGEGDPGTTENVLFGHVTDAAFLGVSTQYIVRTDGGHDIQVFAQNTGAEHETIGPGRRVAAAWDPEHTFVVPKEQEQSDAATH